MRSKDSNELIFDALSSSIAVLDSDGKIIRVNRAWQNFGEENNVTKLVKGGKGSNYFDSWRNTAELEENIREIFIGIKRVINREIDQFEAEYPCDSPLEKRWFLLRAQSFDSSEKEVIITHINITKQKQEELKFINLLNAAPDALVITNKKGIIRLINTHTANLFGYVKDELIGKKVEVLMPKRFRVKHVDYTEMYKDNPSIRLMGQNLDILGLHKNGNEFPVDVSLNTIVSSEEMMIIVALRDITERKKNEQSLIDAFKEIKHLKNELQSENINLREEIKSQHNFEEIIGSSPVLSHTLYKVTKVGPTDTTVLIEGETGTGKELIARAVHKISLRKDKPLYTLNCATLPSNLIESELFGHEKGAFTGALEKKTGRFMMADKATLFIDEIGELPLELQPKLLRVLQEGEFETIGSNKTHKVDVRIIAATNRRLNDEVLAGNFRSDLFYRLAIYTITVPSLRDRIEDIPALTQFFINRNNKILGRNISDISNKTLSNMQNYSWPGNIRELSNVIERAMIDSENNQLNLEIDNSSNISGTNLQVPLADVEREYILKVLKSTNWRIEGSGGSAEVLDLKPTTLRDRMKKYGIKRPL